MNSKNSKLCSCCGFDIGKREASAKLCFPCLRSWSQRSGAADCYKQVSKAIRKGLLKPAKELQCVDCGKDAYCYDHRDYNKPLDVVPVCCSCNKRRGAAIPATKPAEQL